MSPWSCRWLQVDDTVFSRQFNGGRACQVISLPSRCASDLTCCPTFSSGVLVAKLGRRVLRLHALICNPGIFEPGVRQRRPSENVNEHKDTRSFGLREDINVSSELSFGICLLRRADAL